MQRLCLGIRASREGIHEHGEGMGSPNLMPEPLSQATSTKGEGEVVTPIDDDATEEFLEIT